MWLHVLAWICFLLVAMGLAGAAVWFLRRINHVPEAQRSVLVLATLSTGIAATFGLALTIRYDPFAASFAAQGLWSLRFMGWTIAAPLLMLTLTELLAVRDRAVVGVLTAASLEMAYAGAVGTLFGSGTGAWHLVWGAVALSGYAAILWTLLTTLRRAAQDATPTIALAVQRLTLFIVLGWLIYPAVYLLPTLGASAATQLGGQIALSLADIANIAGFGFVAYRAVVANAAAPRQPVAVPEPEPLARLADLRVKNHGR